MCESSHLLSFFEIVLPILGPLHFHMNSRLSLLISAKKPTGILTGIALKFVDQFGKFFLLMILSSNPWTQDVSPFI